MSNKAEEQILVIPADTVAHMLAPYALVEEPADGSLDGFHPASAAVLDVIRPQATFTPRHPAEDNQELKQLIVYAVVMHSGRVLCYQRGKAGQESRLFAKHSIGVGGHINPEDVPDGPGVEAFGAALLRELAEEAGITGGYIHEVNFLGVVNEDSTAVGRVHLGLVFLVELDNVDGLVFEDAFLEPRWLDSGEVRDLESLELWSVMVRKFVASTIDPTAAQDPGRKLKPYQRRVVTEHVELSVKVDALAAFMSSDKFSALPAEEQARLERQHRHMVGYELALRDRVAAF